MTSAWPGANQRPRGGHRWRSTQPHKRKPKIESKGRKKTAPREKYNPITKLKFSLGLRCENMPLAVIAFDGGVHKNKEPGNKARLWTVNSRDQNNHKI